MDRITLRAGIAGVLVIGSALTAAVAATPGKADADVICANVKVQTTIVFNEVRAEKDPAYVTVWDDLYYRRGWTSTPTDNREALYSPTRMVRLCTGG